MNDQKRNLDSLLDDKIKNSLLNFTSEDFSAELMKRIHLEKEFAKEDVKTHNIAKFISAGFVFTMISLVVIFSLSVNTNNNSENPGLYVNLLNSFTGFIELISLKLIDILGVSFSPQTLIILLLIMIFLFAFSFADKIIFKKSM